MGAAIRARTPEYFVRDRVLIVISQILDVPVEQLRDESSPDTVAVWDSLKHMNLILAIEEEFGIYFSDEKIRQMLNVGTIVANVSELTPSGR
jgi:acyl carrier protein